MILSLVASDAEIGEGALLEETFDISFKGREIFKINSYGSGLSMVKKKLKEKGGLA
ncbi:MAG: hypothetical protein K6E33_03115 [Lachnospiraceae bacterium]|nr:hypothetical protein [Lachnospiraceae bacterium]